MMVVESGGAYCVERDFLAVVVYKYLREGFKKLPQLCSGPFPGLRIFGFAPRATR